MTRPSLGTELSRVIPSGCRSTPYSAGSRYTSVLFTLFMNMSCKTMIILSDLGYLLRSELLLQFLGLFRLFELVYVILRTLLLKSLVDLCSEYVISVYSSSCMLILQYSLESCFLSTGSAYLTYLMLRSSTGLWKTFAEPVRFSLCA